MSYSVLSIRNNIINDRLGSIDMKLRDAGGSVSSVHAEANDLIRIFFDDKNETVTGPLGEAADSMPDPVAIGENGGTVRYYAQLVKTPEGKICAAPCPYAVTFPDRPFMGWDAVRKLLSCEPEAENIYAFYNGDRLPVVCFCEIDHTDSIGGMHYFNMDHVEDDSTFIDALEHMDTIDGYPIEAGSPTFTGININSRTRPEELIVGLKSVALLSDTVTAAHGIRKKTPGNWLWYMNPGTEQEEIHVSLQCMNAVGALDRHHEPTGGRGCTMHNAENMGCVSDEHNGRVLAFTYVHRYYVPRNADVENMTYDRLRTYTDKDNADLKKYGGWIIWEAYDSEEQLNEAYGPSDFYTSGMYHFGPGPRDYHHMHMAGVRILPKA